MTQGRRLVWIASTACVMLALFALGWIAGATGIGSAVDPVSLPNLERQFTGSMKGATMVGQFTVAGRPNRSPHPDRYDISSVEKVGDDRWRFNTRMRYGDVDVTLPITVTMRWIGDTPMVTITDLTIPTLGTFTARVLFHRDRYAGTWQHGEVGGHMFGSIEKTQRSD